MHISYYSLLFSINFVKFIYFWTTFFYYFSTEQVHYGDPSAERSYSEDKKDSYRALKPVSEGPVKLDAKSKDSIVVRPAENGEDTSLEAIDSSYTYVIVNKQYVFLILFRLINLRFYTKILHKYYWFQCQKKCIVEQIIAFILFYIKTFLE